MIGVLEDLRYGLRALARDRGFAVAALFSIALGTGANTTIFTFVNAMLLRPLPGVEEPGRLAAVYTQDPRTPGLLYCSYPNYRDYRDRQGGRPRRSSPSHADPAERDGRQRT